MTLERIEHKVFASEAPLDEMGQFGSALATTKLNTKDVAEIQALPAYTKGWGGAIISENNYPAMEEMNGVLNVMSYHTGYLYQEGIPTYSATQNYSATSWVKDLAGKNIYKSKKDNNIGNDLNDSEWFERVDFGGNSLKTNQITNCLLEVPQNIKLELTDGVLTLKAGSKVIVPNGVEDLTSQYPVGATFINDNFKVYDTQYGGGKFFVWVELVNDLVRTGFGSASVDGFFYIAPDSITNENDGIGFTSYHYSGGTEPTQSGSIWYDTANNLVKSNASGSWKGGITLPLGSLSRVNGVATSVNQIFNGLGYIGSTIFMDKGTKVLIPNGRNADGTLNNIEYTTNTVAISDRTVLDGENRAFLFNYTRNALEDKVYGEDNKIIASSGQYIYNPITNNIYNSGGMNSRCVLCGFYTSVNGQITNFQPKLPFRAVDYNDFKENIDGINEALDGEWVNKTTVLLLNSSLEPNVVLEYDLSDYLPNDGNKYEVMYDGYFYAPKKLGEGVYVYVGSDFMSTKSLCECRTQNTTYIQSCSGSSSIIVSTGRKITLKNVSSDTASEANNRFRVLAYRKVR